MTLPFLLVIVVILLVIIGVLVGKQSMHSEQEVVINDCDDQPHPGYFFSIKKMDWSNANAFCVAGRASLVAIESEEENRQLEKKIEEFGGRKRNWWLGGMYRVRQWVWVKGTSFEAVSFSNWQYNRPPELPSQPRELFVISLTGKTLKWTHEDPQEKYHFICEYSKDTNAEYFQAERAKELNCLKGSCEGRG